MSGESIENVTIDLLKTSDAELKTKCDFPVPGTTEDAEKQLNESISESTLQQMRMMPQLDADALKNELRRIVEDRETLRNEVFRTQVDETWIMYWLHCLKF